MVAQAGRYYSEVFSARSFLLLLSSLLISLAFESSSITTLLAGGLGGGGGLGIGCGIKISVHFQVGLLNSLFRFAFEEMPHLNRL